MNRPDYLQNYHFLWEVFDVMVGGKSALDANSYLGQLETKDDVVSFLSGYGFDYNDPVQNAELFGNFQEAVQFIRRYFLKEGNEKEGLELEIPKKILVCSDISDLFLMATNNGNINQLKAENIWAGIILKVMHTILHADKDLRYRYFSTIQFQIFDRFYKFIHRDQDDNLFLKNESGDELIPLVDFQTKAKKSRDSIIIKLLHKTENVAEELFDRIGVRFVTENVVDTLRVMKFLYKNYVISVHNIKPSRSQNSLLDLEKFKSEYFELEKKTIKDNLLLEDFLKEINDVVSSCRLGNIKRDHNEHTLSDYSSFHFTCRQLIKYKNPFMTEFNQIKRMAKEQQENEIAKKIIDLDTSSIAKDIRFFYPFEVQVTDIKSHKRNTEGEASHLEYKKKQLISARNRLFRPLLEFLQ